MMAIEGKLRIVGGNPTLKRLPKSALRAFQPALRLVEPADIDKQPRRRALAVLEKIEGAKSSKRP
jgi:hypothetical protein